MLSITNIIAIGLLLILVFMFFSITFEVRTTNDMDEGKCTETGSNSLRYLSDAWSGKVTSMRAWIKSPTLETPDDAAAAGSDAAGSDEAFCNYRRLYHGEFY